MHIHHKKYLAGTLFMLISFSCKKFIQVDLPENQLSSEIVFTSDLTAKSAAMGIYAKMKGGSVSNGYGGYTYFCALTADELQFMYQGPAQENYSFNDNAILSTSSIIANTWSDHYNVIFNCNTVMEGLASATGVSAAVKDQLKGEALFIRAFYHFYLVNLFGKVPYITTTDYRVNTVAEKAEISAIYAGIIQDLTEAKQLLTDDYAFANGHRSRPNRSTVSALLARVYLYNRQYAAAESESSAVIENPLYDLVALDDVFLIDSKESIWQVEERPGVYYTTGGNLFTNPGSRIDQSITDHLFNSFESQDSRFHSWIVTYVDNGITKHTPAKYKDDYTATALREANTVLRLAEQYLIRAEARAMQDKLTGANSAVSDINKIRDRADLGDVTVTTKEGILSAIADERRHEFFLEAGHRWFDLKRTGRADAVLGPIKPQWTANDTLYPLPFQETLINKKLTQNEGYQ